LGSCRGQRGGGPGRPGIAGRCSPVGSRNNPPAHGRIVCGLRVEEEQKEEEQKEEVGAVGHAVGMPTTLLTYTRVSIRVAPCSRAMACDGLVPVARVNLILQESEAGGNFEYHHRTRDSTDAWAFDQVGRILAGDRSGVSTAGLRAGSLVIFSGR